MTHKTVKHSEIMRQIKATKRYGQRELDYLEDLDPGLNEHGAARILIVAAHGFLVDYLNRDDWYPQQHALAEAAYDAIGTANFVSTEYKHTFLAKVNAKLDAWKATIPHGLSD
jgi:hypothetical protein